MVAINQVVDNIQEIAGIRITRKHLPGPHAVRGRNADLTLLCEILGWGPKTSLQEGLECTYIWIEEQVCAKLGKEAGENDNAQIST